jgi:hypothetical protein
VSVIRFRHASGGAFEGSRAVLDEADLDAGMTACEAWRLLEMDGDAFDTAHRVPPTSVWRVSVSGPGSGGTVLRT